MVGKSVEKKYTCTQIIKKPLELLKDLFGRGNNPLLN